MTHFQPILGCFQAMLDNVDPISLDTGHCVRKPYMALKSVTKVISGPKTTFLRSGGLLGLSKWGLFAF